MSVNSLDSWKHTALCECLSKFDGQPAEDTRTTLAACLPDIERILHAGGAPKDFTLHDENHSYHVAQRMAQIVPDNVLEKLTAYEIGLLLLAAYLHDIGMTPEQQRVRRHYEFLLMGNDELSETEKADFQRWLDDDGRVQRVPIVTGLPTSEQLQLAQELTSYYCRSRHNDWSAEYMRSTLPSIRPGLYHGWIDDLITLCCSHHEGLAELKKERFDPRDVGYPPEVVHLRYLACVLRMSDVLEFDPERTPEVVFRRRDIVPSSVIYWHKDHQVTIRLEEDQLLATARPTSARIHRAIEDMLDQIEAELRVCRTLADWTDFGKLPGSRTPLPHRWDLPASLNRSVQPSAGQYEYIDGAVRPDTSRVLSLLSGTALYSNPLAAVRELLQNAFDAVRQQIAYQRLAAPNPLDRSHVQSLEQIHSVELRLESRGDELWLLCRDSGIGMDKEDIQNRLLVSGKGPRHNIKELERRCDRAGFNLGVTGQYGIGFLSYFMIADHVSVRTRRSPEGGGADGTGWLFTIDGLNQFGELKRDNVMTPGTEVSLRLVSTRLGVPREEIAATLRAYLFDTIARLPCRLTVEMTLESTSSFSREAGWMLQEADMSARLLCAVDDMVVNRQKFRANADTAVPTNLLSAADQQEVEEQGRQYTAFKEDVQRTLRWWIAADGRLPGGRGSYRVRIPYFDLSGGYALAYLSALSHTGETTIERVGEGHFFVPRGGVSVSWKGMNSLLSNWFRPSNRTTQYVDLSSWLDIDLEVAGAGQISASRGFLALSTEGEETIEWVRTQASAKHLDFQRSNANSPWGSINCRVPDAMAVNPSTHYWLDIRRDGDDLREAYWRPVSFPAIDTALYSDGTPANLTVRYRNKRISSIASIREVFDHTFFQRMAWHSFYMAPDRVVVSSNKPFSVHALWLKPPIAGTGCLPWGLQASFAPEWKGLSGAKFREYSGPSFYRNAFIWNPDNPLVQLVDAAGWADATEFFSSGLDPLPHQDRLLASRSCCAGWVMLCLKANAEKLWNGLVEKHKGLVEAFWLLLFGEDASDQEVLFVNNEWSGTVVVLTPQSWRAVKERDDIAKYLPEPGPEWRIDVKYRRAFRKTKRSSA